MNGLPQAIVWLIGVIFGAGGALATLRLQQKQQGKHLNGIGQCMREGFRRTDRKIANMERALYVVLEKREDRQRLADLLREQ